MNARLSMISLSIAALLIAAFVFAQPSFATEGVEIVNTALNPEGCFVDITIRVSNGGYYAVNVWDDGSFLGGAGENFNANEEFTLRVMIGGVMQSALPGVGVYVEDGVGYDATTTFAQDDRARLWSDSVGSNCAELGMSYGSLLIRTDTCANPLPSGAFAYNVPAGALAFYAPNPDTYAGFNLPPGHWYVTSFGESYAQVWIACSAAPVYIPVENIIR